MRRTGVGRDGRRGRSARLGLITTVVLVFIGAMWLVSYIGILCNWRARVNPSKTGWWGYTVGLYRASVFYQAGEIEWQAPAPILPRDWSQMKCRFGHKHLKWHRDLVRWWPQFTWVSNTHCVTVPLWIPAALLLALSSPVYVKLARGRRARLSKGCDNCRYDLTGNVSGRCPECGKPVTTDGRETQPAQASEENGL